MSPAQISEWTAIVADIVLACSVAFFVWLPFRDRKRS